MVSLLRTFLLATILALASVTTADAGPFRGRAFHGQTTSSYPSCSSCAGAGGCVTGACPAAPIAPPTAVPDAADPLRPADGLDEVNAKRAARGLRPLIRDDGLTHAARDCAVARALRGLFGHTSNDFAFLPPGCQAAAAGCAAHHVSYGWMSCCTYDSYTYGGAAWVTGRDGKRYMHLFCR